MRARIYGEGTGGSCRTEPKHAAPKPQARLSSESSPRVGPGWWRCSGGGGVDLNGATLRGSAAGAEL